MKKSLIPLALCIFSMIAYGQNNQYKNFSDSNVNYTDIIYTDEINGINVFNTDTFNQIVQEKIKQQKIIIGDETHPKVYLLNNSKNRYLKIWGGPDLGFGWFFTIGYFNHEIAKKLGVLIGQDNVSDFIVNNGIKLGDKINQVWAIAHLEYFRSYTFRDLKYFYFEKGIRRKVPYTPNQVFYYIFDKDDKLIEIGFGYGMTGENPMLSSIE